MTITIDRAIQHLTNLAIHHRDPTYHDDEQAMKLGIEALKRIKEARKKVYFTARSLLPGETKE